MVFKALISIVFIAELIITFAVITNLIRFDKRIMERGGYSPFKNGCQ